jgi:hypothetical protein
MVLPAWLQMEHLPAGMDNITRRPLEELGIDRAITVPGYVTGQSRPLGLKPVGTRHFRMHPGWWNLHVSAGVTTPPVMGLTQKQGMNALVGIRPWPLVLRSVRDCWAPLAFGRYDRVIGQTVMFATRALFSGLLGPWNNYPSLMPELDRASVQGTWSITDISDGVWMVRNREHLSHLVVLNAPMGKSYSDPVRKDDDMANVKNCRMNVQPRMIGLRSPMFTAAWTHADDSQDLVALAPAQEEAPLRPHLRQKRRRAQKAGNCEMAGVPKKNKKPGALWIVRCVSTRAPPARRMPVR